MWFREGHREAPVSYGSWNWEHAKQEQWCQSTFAYACRGRQRSATEKAIHEQSGVLLPDRGGVSLQLHLLSYYFSKMFLSQGFLHLLFPLHEHFPPPPNNYITCCLYIIQFLVQLLTSQRDLHWPLLITFALYPYPDYVFLITLTTNCY